MIKLYDNGVYLMNGTQIVEDTGNAEVPISKEEAAQNTMAYSILKEHNTSPDMKNPTTLHLSGLFRRRVRQD